MTYALVLFAKQLGGHELMSLKLATQMRLSGLEVVVFCPRGMSNVDRLLDEYPEVVVEYYGLNCGGDGFFSSILSRFRLAYRLTRDGSFIVNCQGSFEQNFLFTIFIKLLLGRVISYVPYTSMPSERLAKLGGLRDFFQRPLAATADFIIVIHNCYKKDLTHRYRISADKVFVVENIAAIQSSEDPALSRVRESEQQIITFVMPGRIYFKQKGQDILLSALAAVVLRDENVRLKFIGDGPDVSRLENSILDDGLSKYAKLLGWQSDTDKIYESGDAVLLPSRYEGVSLVMLEAIQRGLPIVASNLPINEEFISSEYLCKSGDSLDLAEKMLFIAQRLRSGGWSKASNYEAIVDPTGENQRAIKKMDRAACRVN